MIKISDCPITGLERKIVKKNILIYETTEQVLLECIISHFKDGELIDNSRIKSYVVTLVASNNTFVDKTTGEEVADSEAPNAIGQFDFFVELQKVPVVQLDLIKQHITKADLRGKFNN